MNERVFKKPMFGKEVVIVLFDIDDVFSEYVVDETYKQGLWLQKIFNVYDKDSEISELNLKRKLKVSSEMREILTIALNFSKLTKGRYDVTLGKQVLERKNSDRSKPGSGELKIDCTYKDVTIEGNKVILKNDDVLIDLGSVAKGYIADKMVEHLVHEGVENGLIDARGDIRVFGETNFVLGVQHPRDHDKVITQIKLQNLSVSTSGDYYQYYGNYGCNHILNNQNLVSVTVVGQNLTICELLSTSIFVSDEKERLKIIDRYKKYKVLTVDRNLIVKRYNGFSEIEINAN